VFGEREDHQGQVTQIVGAQELAAHAVVGRERSLVDLEDLDQLVHQGVTGVLELAGECALNR